MAFDPNPGGTDTDYDLVLIGRGYSIATYLLMADLSWAQRIAILGGPDAWDQQLRGDGIVNHAQFLVDPRFAERLAVTQEATKRADFLASNASVFEAARDGLGDNQPIVWPGGEPTGLKTAFGKDAVSQVALDGSVPFLVVSVTPVREAAGAPIQRGVKYTGGGPAPALDLAQGARLCVYEIGYKDAGAGDTTNPKRIRAMRVVFGGGAGPHRVPGFAAGLVDSQAGTISYTADDQVMDLDGFMRRFGSVGQPSPELAGQTVAVIGPNAGVDAAVTALQKQAKLKWLISGRPGSKPAWLATEHYDPNFGALRDEAHRNIVNFQDDRARQIGLTIAESGTDGDGQKVYDVTLPDVTQDGQTYWSFGVSPDAQGVALRRLDPAIFVRLTGPALTFKARFIVYAIGQDPTLTEKIGNAITRIGPAKVLQKPVLDSLVPLYDVNQRFGPPTGTVLGLATRMAWDDQGQAFVGNVTQAVDLLQRNQPTYELYETDRFRGLEVVGAAVFALRDKAVPVEQFTRKEIAQQLGEAMSNLPKALRQKAVATADQLAALRSGIEAATGADFRNQVSTMTGFQVAEANYREAVAAVQQDTGVLGEQQTRARALRQSASLLLLALSPAARNAYREMYEQRRGEMNQALGEAAPLDADFFVAWMARAQSWMGTVSSAVSTFLLPAADYALVQKAATDSLAPLDKVTPAITWLQQHAAADYNGMDQTALAVLIATNYPHILPEAWQEITGKIIQQRNDVSAWGYDQDQLMAISDWLAEVDRLSVPLMTARQEKQPLPQQAVEALAQFLTANPKPWEYPG